MQRVFDKPTFDAYIPGAPYAISGIGVLLLILWGWYAVRFEYATVTGHELSPNVVIWLKLTETALVVGLSGTLVYAGYWFATSQYSLAQQWWGAVWTVIGSVGITAVILVVNAHQLTEGLLVTPHVLVEEILLGAAGGSLAGLLIGIGTAQTMHQAEQVKKQRDAFAFLTKLLRHNILNGITIIQGRASVLAEDAPPERRSQLDTIVSRSSSIADLTQNVQHMARVLSGEVTLEPIDLADVLREEIETADQSFGTAEFSADLTEETRVRANQALSAVFDNLLSNAVVHNDADTPEVTITVEAVDEEVHVRIADNGPGIPDEKKETIFEPNDHGDHGIGLFLANTIVTHYGGEIQVKDNEPTGTVFTVVLRQVIRWNRDGLYP